VSTVDTMTLRHLKQRVLTWIAPRRVERDLDDELSFHLEREMHEHIARGLSPDDARARARARFGSIAVAADACRDERGTAWFDSVKRDVLYAVRTFRRAPLTALTMVATLALGLSLVAVVFTMLSVFIFRVDEVRNVHELFAVARAPSAHGDSVPFTRPQFDALARETSVFSGVFARFNGGDTRIDGRMMTGTLVTGNFFQVLGVNAALGRTLTPADDARGGGYPAVVLSHRGWTQFFGSDPNILNRTILVNGAPFQIVGVMPDGFRGLKVSASDYWAPLSFLGQFRPKDAGRDDTVALEIIGRLRPGLSREQALAELVVWDSRGVARGSAAGRATPGLVLESRQGTVPQPAEALLLFAPLFFAFGLVLLIACANVANLLLARGMARQREIGIRLAIGASRGRIVWQLLTESLLLALVSAAVAFALSRILLSTLIYAVTTSMPPDIGDISLNMPGADWRVALFLLGGAMVSTMFFALAPALQATRLELVRAMRGEVMRDARPGRARGALVALQTAASALLLICAAVFLRSAIASATVDPGIRTADTVMIAMLNESKRGAMLDALKGEPIVAAIAASWPDAAGRPPRAALAEGTGGASGKSAVAYRFVSPEYFNVLGIDILRGRGFTPAERSTNAAVAVVSESVAKQLWPGGDAMGQILQLEPDTKEKPREGEPPLLSRTFVIVGVARDVAGFRLADYKEAGIYVPIDTTAAGTSFTVRVHGDPELARRTLLDRLTAVDPDMGQVVTMRTVASIETYLLQIAFGIALALGTLALVLTLSGLFSVLSYLVEQRTREIGVRMALGATPRLIAGLVLRQSARPVGIGLFAGCSLALALGAALLATPLAAQIGTYVRIFDPIAYAVSLAGIIAACTCAALIPALRAGRIDPLTTLRQD
jgi:predicted permease